VHRLCRKSQFDASTLVTVVADEDFLFERLPNHHVLLVNKSEGHILKHE
jgi:hypothetical protein